MRNLNIKNIIIKYLLSFIFVFIILFIVKSFLNNKELNINKEIVPSIIKYNDELTIINVKYPRFNSDKINNIVTNMVYSYVKNFKNNNKNKSLFIDYDIYHYNDYINIVFNINDSLNNIKYKNIIINLKEKKLSYISNLFDKEYLINKINDLVYHKYSTDIYELIKNENINNFTYLIDENKITVFFNNIVFKNIDYIPFVIIDFDQKVSSNYSYIEGKKYIAFTYDDGPSEYTTEVLKTIEANNSSATFFMIGNRMKKYRDIVLDIYNSNSEIGSHTYSHKNLLEIDEESIDSELNTTNLIFNEITNDNIKYLRPPYGKYDKIISSKGYKIILWNIDPKDWLLQDSTKIYNNVIKNSCDGCIVLFHDIYKETVEATKMLIPALNEMNYEIVSISKLIDIKKYD